MDKGVRGERLRRQAPMEYAPVNEQGVVFLFAHAAEQLGFTSVTRIQQGFPDCIAHRRRRGREETVRIEFELYSRTYLTHRHPLKGADCIVCWRNNWPDAPEHLEIIELAEHYGVGRNVWLIPVRKPYKAEASRAKRAVWSVPHWARVGDLVLLYLTMPEGYIRDLFRVTSPPRMHQYGSPPKRDCMAEVRRLCRLDDPLHLETMRNDPVLRNAGFVRAQIQGRREATPQWPRMRQLMMATNPSTRRLLETLT